MHLQQELRQYQVLKEVLLNKVNLSKYFGKGPKDHTMVRILLLQWQSQEHCQESLLQLQKSS